MEEGHAFWSASVGFYALFGLVGEVWRGKRACILEQECGFPCPFWASWEDRGVEKGQAVRGLKRKLFYLIPLILLYLIPLILRYLISLKHKSRKRQKAQKRTFVVCSFVFVVHLLICLSHNAMENYSNMSTIWNI